MDYPFHKTQSNKLRIVVKWMSAEWILNIYSCKHQNSLDLDVAVSVRRDSEREKTNSKMNECVCAQWKKLEQNWMSNFHQNFMQKLQRRLHENKIYKK